MCIDDTSKAMPQQPNVSRYDPVFTCMPQDGLARPSNAMSGLSAWRNLAKYILFSCGSPSRCLLDLDLDLGIPT